MLPFWETTRSITGKNSLACHFGGKKQLGVSRKSAFWESAHIGWHLKLATIKPSNYICNKRKMMELGQDIVFMHIMWVTRGNAVCFLCSFVDWPLQGSHASYNYLGSAICIFPFVLLLNSMQVYNNCNIQISSMHTVWCRFPIWSYAKLFFSCWLVLPYFNGAAYVYQHFVRPLLVNKQTVNIWYIPRKEDIIRKPEDILSAAKKYIEENGPKAFETLISKVSSCYNIVIVLPHMFFWTCHS